MDDSTPTSIATNPGNDEHFVEAAKVAQFLAISRKHVLRLSIQGRIPAHPISFGNRNSWRYLL